MFLSKISEHCDFEGVVFGCLYLYFYLLSQGFIFEIRKHRLKYFNGRLKSGKMALCDRLSFRMEGHRPFLKILYGCMSS